MYRALLILLCLAGLSWNRLSWQRAPAQAQNVSGMPPGLAVSSMALGPLRSLAADAVFWRMAKKQERKEFIEAAQLASLVSKMQPKYASVWCYQGWNLSYNVSVKSADPAERFAWIMAGLRLLRDEGLKYNPGNKEIKLELLRIFADKFDGQSDDSVAFLRDEWVRQMLPILPLGDRAELAAAAAAATSAESLLARPGVARLVKAGRARGVDPLASSAPSASAEWLRQILGAEPRPEDLPQLLAAAGELENFWRRRMITEGLNMDLERMLLADREYGPLDWRTHQAHGIYWGANQDFAQLRNSSGTDLTNYVYSLMLSSFYQGKIIFNPADNSFVRTQNLDVLAKIHEFLEAKMADPLLSADARKKWDNKHQIFIHDAALVCFNSNQGDASRELFAHYKAGGYCRAELSFEQFLIDSMEMSLARDGIKDRPAMIEAILRQSLVRATAGDVNGCNGLRNKAMLMWRQHQKQWENTGRALPPFTQLYEAAKRSYAPDPKRSQELEQQLDKAKAAQNPAKIKT